MSLVVAGIHDGESVTFVGDTKITWDGDPTGTLRTYRNALAKLVLLRDDLAVGVTGAGPETLIRAAVSMREEPVEEVLAGLAAFENAAFVVAALAPARLWLVADGEVEERTAIGRAWAGDQGAYSTFQQKYGEWPDDTPVPFRLTSAMQFLTSFDTSPTVGGYTVRAAGSAAREFRFIADQMHRGPWYMQVTGVRSEYCEEHGHVHQVVTAEVPDGYDPTPSSTFLLPGRGATPGALGLLVPEAGVGILFTHDDPAEGIHFRAANVEEFARTALAEHGQDLTAPRAGRS